MLSTRRQRRIGPGRAASAGTDPALTHHNLLSRQSDMSKQRHAAIDAQVDRLHTEECTARIDTELSVKFALGYSR